MDMTEGEDLVFEGNDVAGISSVLVATHWITNNKLVDIEDT